MGGKHLDLIYHRATTEDLEVLTKTRAVVLREANGLPEDADMSRVETGAREYYRRALADGSHVAYLVYDGETLVGAGGVSFYQVTPTYRNPTGKKAYIMNIYTAPSHRRRGIAWRTLDLLVGEARRAGAAVTLEATAMGRPMYEKYGFVKLENEMKLPEGVSGGETDREIRERTHEI